MQPPQRILVPVDYEAAAQGALRCALELASKLNSQVDVLYVWAAPYAEKAISSADVQPEPHTLFDHVRGRCAEQMHDFVATFQTEFPNVPLQWFVESGQARDQVFEHVKKRGCDLIVMGTRGRTGPARWWLGSVAEYIVRHAPCPVMVVPRAADDAAPKEA